MRGEIAVGVVEGDHRPVADGRQKGVDFRVQRRDPPGGRIGVCQVGCGIFRIKPGEFQCDQAQPGLAVVRIKPGMRVDAVMRMVVAMVVMAVVVMGMVVMVRIAVVLILGRRAIGPGLGRPCVQQAQRRRLGRAQAKRAVKPGGQVRPDPDHKVGPRDRGRLAGTQLEGVFVGATVQQQFGLAQIAHDLGHQRMDRGMSVTTLGTSAKAGVLAKAKVII